MKVQSNLSEKEIYIALTEPSGYQLRLNLAVIYQTDSIHIEPKFI
jgi:hypothetical protein